MSTLAEDYLRDRDGSVSDYHRCLAEGQRVGQAFFNALNLRDTRRLRCTDVDPFYAFESERVQRAIAYLLDTEGTS